MTKARLSTPLVNVTRASDPEKTLEVQTTNIDLILWDRTRIKHKWPAADAVPMMWLTFVTWAAARRSGLIGQDIRYEAWEADVLAIDVVTDDDDNETGEPFPEGFTGAAGGGDSASDEHGTG